MPISGSQQVDEKLAAEAVACLEVAVCNKKNSYFSCASYASIIVQVFELVFLHVIFFFLLLVFEITIGLIKALMI